MVYSNVQAQDADYHYMIAQATKAPSGHNTQPWLFEIKETVINNPDGSIRVSKTTKVTGKGQIYFVNRYCGGYKEEIA